MSHEMIPVPIRSKVIDAAGVLTRDLVRFLDTIRQWLSNTAQRAGSASGTAESASIPATDVQTSPLSEGLYRASYSLRIVQAATTSSSAAMTMSWVSNSVTCSESFPAVTGNTLSSQTSGSILFSVDGGSQVQYAVSYSSSGATPMQYSFDFIVEELL